MLKRNLSSQLLQWKSKAGRLPLILWGARQVGKSTTVEAFGAGQFEQCHTFNFQKNASLKLIFDGDLDPPAILQALELVTGKKITPRDLVFFDEIQECPQAVTSLKYFSEATPEQAVIAAGSYLGLIQNESAFPVGKVEFLSLHPLTFFEFLQNLEPATFEVLSQLPHADRKAIPEFYHQRALYWLRLYLCIGGLPQAVQAFASNITSEIEAAKTAREIQNRLIEGYRSDFSKYSGTVNANHILRVFDSTSIQLGQSVDESVNKFKFAGVIPKKKGFESIDGPLTWLEKSRLVIKTHIASKFEHPIKAFTKSNSFKVYLFDVGLLNAMLEVPVESLLMNALGSYKGFIAENFVAQELFARLDHPLVGWSESESEVEFVISLGAHLCPIEVKASSKARRAKSLDMLISKYHPALSFKTTGQNREFAKDKKVLTLPMYLVETIFKESPIT